MFNINTKKSLKTFLTQILRLKTNK